jgi:glutamate-ammonia-ligase adenylyltransferase
MQELARAFEESLDRGVPDPALLARAGEIDLERAVAAFAAAAGHPALAPSVVAWLPVLLASARPGFGAEQLVALADRHENVCRAPLPPAALPHLAAVVGASNFLARLLVREPARVADVADSADGGLPTPLPPGAPEPDWSAIRTFKYRGLLRIAARDLAERPFEASPRELSDLADACLAAALDCAATETGGEAPCLLALGKLGGRELNFSSDVDLLFLYEAADQAADWARNEAVAPLIRRFKQGLEKPHEDGFAYRVDLDLRPEGAQGALANSVDAALSYYESFGHEWERQAMIRLRVVAGPLEAGRRFQRTIAPFVFRRLIDPAVPRAVRAMKTRIEEERVRAGRDLEVDLKEGPGGIRDVEFLVQALQLFFGGREPQLRAGSVPEVLRRLAALQLLPEETAGELVTGYLWLRRAEHALQLVEERQTRSFPREAAAQLALARRMGYRDPDGARARDRLLDDWTSVRACVRAAFDALVLGGGDDVGA